MRCRNALSTCCCIAASGIQRHLKLNRYLQLAKFGWHVDGPSDAANQADKARDGGRLAEATNRAEMWIVAVHRQVFWSERTAAVVQQDVPGRVQNSQDAADRNHDGRTVLPREGVWVHWDSIPSIPDETSEEHHVGAQSEVVRSLAVIVRCHVAAGAEKRHQQQRPASAAQDARQGHADGGHEGDGSSRRRGGVHSRWGWSSFTALAVTSHQRVAL